MRAVALAVPLALVLLIAGGIANAASPYPSPAPDFAHPGTNHNNYYGITAGQQDRPMLVILRGFTDQQLAAGFDEAWAQATFFGGTFPSLANYFSDDSFGDLLLTPASETCGTANNGVAVVTTGTRADYDGMTEAARNRSSVDAVDGCVDFAVFDSNNDGTITNLELVIMNINASASAAENCGATRGISSGAIDGKNFASNYGVGMGATATNLMTHIHEMAHVALNMSDLYGYGVGSFDISGPTCGAGAGFFMRTSAWQKMHWGWITPTVVVNDGYYTVSRADTSGQAFILYDYARGTNDYFIVENRQRTANTYDASASDNGLVIWRIDETKYDSGDTNQRPIDIMRPDGTTTPTCATFCYSGTNTDAWNPSDSATPQRTMARTWRDGTASNVAVRAIGPSGDQIRVYFDVRGPGVLVDPTNANGTPIKVDLPLDYTTTVSFSVMNTGETSDTFDFSVVGLPSGWSSSTHQMTLAAGAGATANVQITVPLNATTGVYTVRARGVSTTDNTVASEADFQVEAILHQTSIQYTGVTSAPWGSPAGFEAQLSDVTVPGTQISGATVNFVLSNGTDSQTLTATSNATGLASANSNLTVPPGDYTLTITMPRYSKHETATTSVAYTVTKRPTTLTYTGDTTADYSDPAALSGTLIDTLAGTPLSGKTVSFTLGTQSTSGVTDASGIAQSSITIDQPAGNVSVEAAFAEDDLYLGSSSVEPFDITKETLNFVYTGSTLVSDQQNANLQASATEEADGSPGDLSLAEATFTLTPLLTPSVVTHTAPVDATGIASTSVAVSADVWTVTVAVPASNPYWESDPSAPVELVIFDPDGRAVAITGGYDMAQKRTALISTSFYVRNKPVGIGFYSSSVGYFAIKNMRWLVTVNHQAVAEYEGIQIGIFDGKLGARPVILRVRLQDGSGPLGSGDRFQVWMRTPNGTQLYESGIVTNRTGYVFVR